MGKCNCKNKVIGSSVSSLYIVGSLLNKVDTANVLVDRLNYSVQQANAAVDIVDVSGRFMLYEGTLVKANEIQSRLSNAGILCNIVTKKM